MGNWSATFVIPATGSGLQTIAASGSFTPTVTVTFTVFSQRGNISVSPLQGYPGSSAKVTGTNFGSYETDITVTYDGKPLASSISADGGGSWSASFVVPPSPSGSHVIGAYGPATPAVAVSNKNFIVTPIISISPAFGPPGTSVTVTGSGFGASETGITVIFAGNQIASGISANTLGGWSTSIVIPASPSGPYIIGAYGPATSVYAVPGVTFTNNGP